MKKLIKILLARLNRLFFKSEIKDSINEEHWVNHIHDETITWPNKAMMWMNVHGFDEGPGNTYWLGLDGRSFGIRVSDYVLKFKTKALYDEYLDYTLRNPEKVLYKMRDDSRLIYKYGDDVEIKFIFRWGDDDKSFNVRFATDSYAVEK